MEEAWIEMFPGVRRSTIAVGAQLMQMHVLLDQNSVVPEHAHPHEQVTYVLRGRLRFTIAGEVRELLPGEAWAIPGNVKHMVEALEETLVVDTFSPPREDLLAQDRGEVRGEASPYYNLQPLDGR